MRRKNRAGNTHENTDEPTKSEGEYTDSSQCSIEMPNFQPPGVPGVAPKQTTWLIVTK